MLCKKPIIIGNLLSLAGALLFLTLFFIGPDQSALINSFGSKWVRAYFSPHQSQTEGLLEEVRKGQIDRAKKLVQTKWQSIAKKDRVYPLKRKLLLAIAKELHRQGQYDELYRWATQWQKLDRRDIDAIAFLYEALYRLPDQKIEGLEGLKREWWRFPYNSMLTRFYYAALMEQGLKDDAKVVYKLAIDKMRLMSDPEEGLIDLTQAFKGWKLTLYSTPILTSDSDYESYVNSREGLARTWELINDFLKGRSLTKYPTQHGLTPTQQAKYWVRQGALSKITFGKLLAGMRKPVKVVKTQRPRFILTNEHWLGLVIDLDSKFTALRVDLPPGLNIQIGAIRLRIGSIVQRIPLDKIEVKNMDRIGAVLSTAHSADPYLSFSVQDSLSSGRAKNNTNIVVELDAQLATLVGNIPPADWFMSNKD